MSTEIRYTDLEDAFLWASSASGFQVGAFICRSTGKTYFLGDDLQDELPTDIEDDTRYAVVPGKNDLDLGRALVTHFICRNAPQLERSVQDIFRRKGAYSRLKELLLDNDLLDKWHQYENRATQDALEAWATENGFSVRHAS